MGVGSIAKGESGLTAAWASGAVEGCAQERYDNSVQLNFDLERGEVFCRIEREVQDGGGAAGDGAALAVEGYGIEDAGGAGAQVDARGEWGVVDEEVVVEEIVLLDGPPVFGVAQAEGRVGCVSLCNRDGGVGHAAALGEGGACDEEVDAAGVAGEGEPGGWRVLLPVGEEEAVGGVA